MQIQGAISNKRSEILLKLGIGNNGKSYCELIEAILEWIERPNKTVVVLDNASFHRNQESIKMFTDKGVSLLFLPPSSSDLNPIGKCPFSIVDDRTTLFSQQRNKAVTLI